MRGWGTRSKILYELVDVDGHLAFIEGLLARHAELDPGDRARIEAELGRVRERQADPCVTMAVVGEFSAGKSSFINALLREELFETDAVQGTTAAATVIEYGPGRVLRLARDGERGPGEVVAGPGERAEIASALAERTSGEGVGAGEHLVLEHPSDFLRNGVRIIDTPGTNSLSGWHDEVTRRALTRLADACIVLSPAVEALSQTLRDFLGENLSGQLPSCVFVLTKIDLVRPRERARLVAYTHKVLADEFGLRDAPVLTYCSLPEVKDLELTNLETERALVEQLRERRVELQLRRCVTLLGRALSAVEASIDHAGAERRRERERLEAATTADLGEFVAARRRERLRSFQDHVDDQRRSLMADLTALEGSAREEAERGLDACATQAQVRAYLSTGLVTRLGRWRAGALERLGNGRGGLAATDAVRETARAGRAAFERAFLAQYRSLDALARELSLPVDVSFELDGSSLAEEIGADDLAERAAQSETADTARFVGSIAGGAATGAAIGSVVPGVGTLVGGVLGGMAGFMGWNSTSNDPTRVRRLRDAVRDSVRSATDAYLRSVERAVQRGFIAYANAAWSSLDRLMDDYLDAYGSAIEAMRARDCAEQDRVGRELEALRDDRRLVEARMAELRATAARLHEV